MAAIFVLIASMTGAIPPEIQKLLDEKGIGVESYIILMLFNIIILVGAANMRKGRYYGLAMVASVLCILCNSLPYHGLGLIVGIWSMVVLNKPEVKMEFR